MTATIETRFHCVRIDDKNYAIVANALEAISLAAELYGPRCWDAIEMVEVVAVAPPFPPAPPKNRRSRSSREITVCARPR